MKKVLVIDDQEQLREIVSMGLTHTGFEVIQASSAAEAETTLSNWQPDLILCDLHLEDGDGFSVLEWVRGRNETVMTPFVMMTGLIDEFPMETMKPDAYLSKPFELQILFETVQRLLN